MKNSLWSRIGIFTISGSILLASCSSLTEEPIQLQEAGEVSSASDVSNDINARKKTAVERNYFEKFTNQLGSVDENGQPTNLIPAYFPGTGEGNSTHMGKAITFLNQYAFFNQNGLNTIGAPVTQFYAQELAEIGITNIPDNVSSITTDGKGNSVWFENIQNTVTPAGAERTDFVAEVKIIGGTGKFENATGDGLVVGYFNPQTGMGSSTINGKIIY